MAVFSLANLAYVKREERRRKANFGKKDFLRTTLPQASHLLAETTIRAEDLDTPLGKIPIVFLFWNGSGHNRNKMSQQK